MIRENILKEGHDSFISCISQSCVKLTISLRFPQSSASSVKRNGTDFRTQANDMYDFQIYLIHTANFTFENYLIFHNQLPLSYISCDGLNNRHRVKDLIVNAQY